MKHIASIKSQMALLVWTLGVWGSRVRNIQADVDLAGTDRVVSLTIAYAFVVLGVITSLALIANVRVGNARWVTLPLGALVLLGIVRWTLRGPVILWSDEWEVGFKVVHTVLWLVTVGLSVLAWREHRKLAVASSS